jgi:hypothetical protein
MAPKIIDKYAELRNAIQENLRVQRGSAENVTYIDSGTEVSDISARQNHVIFARRGCGKTLLLQYSSRHLSKDKESVYLNCEDFKHHSFPNVLIEIFDALFGELEKHLKGWFGKKRRLKELIINIRQDLNALRQRDDFTESAIKTFSSAESSLNAGADLSYSSGSGAGAKGSLSCTDKQKEDVEKQYTIKENKIREINLWLPRLKQQLRDFFEISSSVKTLFLQIDDLYHLRQEDQPFVVDYVHRLCKDVPIFFKLATLRHVSILYSDHGGQPIGAQERHDYQPINIDYTFEDFRKTREKNRRIFHEFGNLAGIKKDALDNLFKGEGFDRLVLAGGGVPRDTLSLFLEVLSNVQQYSDGRIGKDDVRILSKSNFEHLIQELKHDSEVTEQEPLIKAIYVIREFCLDKQTNAFLISERILQQNDSFRKVIYRLLDYRIIHTAATALTHKSKEGTYQAFSINIGCYAHLRKLQGKFNEIDLSTDSAKDRLRSAPVLELESFNTSFSKAPDDAEKILIADED